MATRLSVITTRTGDQGSTGLGDGSRIGKNATRIAALGDVDELNSSLGLLRTENLAPDIDSLLARIQHDLFDMGAELCIPGHTALTDDHVLTLEQALTHYNAELGKLEEFILPGGCRAAAQAHVVRTICRRAERAVVTLDNDPTDSAGVATPIKQYLNRLSDLMFVLARALNHNAGQPDVLWDREKH